MGWDTIFYFYQKWVDILFLSLRNYGIAKISLGLRKFRYAIAKFTAPLCWILHPASGSLLFFFLFSCCFENLHSLLAEIDIRPYKIGGNQSDFGYDWIDTIIWLPIHAKTIKTASECI